MVKVCVSVVLANWKSHLEISAYSVPLCLSICFVNDGPASQTIAASLCEKARRIKFFTPGDEPLSFQACSVIGRQDGPVCHMNNELRSDLL